MSFTDLRRSEHASTDKNEDIFPGRSSLSFGEKIGRELLTIPSSPHRHINVSEAELKFKGRVPIAYCESRWNGSAKMRLCISSSLKHQHTISIVPYWRNTDD